jgi:hypothetical protein
MLDVRKRDEIVGGVITLLRQHQNNLRGSFHQEPYKGDFFRLFAAAYNGGLIDQGQPNYLSADALTDVITARDPDVLDTKAWRDLHSAWQDWTYAWRRSDELERR